MSILRIYKSTTHLLTNDSNLAIYLQSIYPNQALVHPTFQAQIIRLPAHTARVLISVPRGNMGKEDNVLCESFISANTVNNMSTEVVNTLPPETDFVNTLLPKSNVVNILITRIWRRLQRHKSHTGSYRPVQPQSQAAVREALHRKWSTAGNWHFIGTTGN